MSDQPSNNEPMEPKTPGELLREAREYRGFQQSTVADRMRLSVQTIIDIENDDYSHFPAEIYLRGHLRTYSRMVNLDEDKVLQSYEATGFVFESDNRDRMLSNQTAPVTTRTRHSKKRTLLWVGISVMLILIVMVVMWWREQQSHMYYTLSSKMNTPTTRVQTIPITTTMPKPPSNVVKKVTKKVTYHQARKKTAPKMAAAPKKPVRMSANSNSMKDFVPDYKIVPVKQ